MRNLSRDTWIAIGLLVILAIITAGVAIRQAEEATIPYASFSNAPDGTRALKLWLEALDYETVAILSSEFVPPQDATLLFILEPTDLITEEEWQTIDEWITAGGTLVLAGNLRGSRAYFQHFDCKLSFLDAPIARALPQVPLLTSPPLEESVKIETLNFLEINRTDYVTLLATNDKPIAITFKQGEGRVILSAAPYPFSNAGLKENGNPSFVLNMVGLSGPPTLVWFDEWHHGIRTTGQEILGPGNWLRRTSAGQALLFTTGVIFVALVLRGRHFGRPITPVPEDTRRTPIEHVTSIANLNRRAKHRQAVLDQYRQELKRSLGRRYHINPTLPDAHFLAELSRVNPRLDRKSLGTLLNQLRNPKVSETEMLALATQVTEWLEHTKH